MPFREAAATVVIATRNRRRRLLETIARLQRLPERPPIIVVDNASNDGTPAAIAECFSDVRLIPCRDNVGAAARNLGVEEANTPLVAFSDDDSWWQAGALEKAARYFDHYHRLALLATRVLVGQEQCLDPVCINMARSPLGQRVALPGPRVLGFVACGAIVRRAAFLEAGGFEQRFGVGGEEELLALDLAVLEWHAAYADDIVAYHVPDTCGPRPGRRVCQLRNQLWSAWLRRNSRAAWRQTWRSLKRLPADHETRTGMLQALAGLPWVWRQRRVIPDWLEADLARLSADIPADRSLQRFDHLGGPPASHADTQSRAFLQPTAELPEATG